MSAHSVSPPTGGHLDGAQHRAERRALAPGDVAVPDVLVAAGCRSLLEAHDLGRLLGLRRGARADERVALEPAPVAGEGRVLLVGEVLVAEEQHLPLEQRPVELGEQLVVERIGERRRRRPGADGRRQRCEREARVRRVDPAGGRAAAMRGPGRRAGMGRSWSSDVLQWVGSVVGRGAGIGGFGRCGRGRGEQRDGGGDELGGEHVAAEAGSPRWRRHSQPATVPTMSVSIWSRRCRRTAVGRSAQQRVEPLDARVDSWWPSAGRPAPPGQRCPSGCGRGSGRTSRRSRRRHRRAERRWPRPGRRRRRSVAGGCAASSSAWRRSLTIGIRCS